MLVIDRAPPPAAYLEAGTEVRSGGSARRSVPNMPAIFDAIAARHDAMLVRMEDCTLFEQIFLFSRAWRVVAQHGAALSHLIWARPDAGLVEILPNPGGLATDRAPRKGCFRVLCERLAMPRQVVSQQNHHAPVDPAAVLQALAELG